MENLNQVILKKILTKLNYDGIKTINQINKYYRKITKDICNKFFWQKKMENEYNFDVTRVSNNFKCHINEKIYNITIKKYCEWYYLISVFPLLRYDIELSENEYIAKWRNNMKKRFIKELKIMLTK